MARTPLLRAFQRLAEEHRTAERLGIPPAELRGRRRRRVSRARVPEARRRRPAPRSPSPGRLALAQRASARHTAPRIAIVGGGIAGLNAALTLADKGVASTVYEASTARRRPHALGHARATGRTGRSPSSAAS